MTDSLPDPLSLWLHASGVPSEAVDAESLAASMQALWSNQEELVRTLGVAFNQTDIAELAIELMLHPLIRQAQLLELAPRPNPEQAVLLGVALSRWLEAQVALAQSAAGDLQNTNWSEAGVSILQAWVCAFANRQATFLACEKGQQMLASLTQAWAGLNFRPASIELAAADLRPAQLVSYVQEPASDKATLLVIAPPWCPLASFDAATCGLIKGLQKSFNLQVLDWGELQQVQSAAALREQVASVLSIYSGLGTLALDMTNTEFLPTDSSLEVHRLSLSSGLGRLRPVFESQSLQQLGLSQDFVPGELIAVLCDAVFPDWAVDAWLQSEGGGSALQLRRVWLDAMPSVSGSLLRDWVQDDVLAEKQMANGGHSSVDESLTLLQLLNGVQVEELCQILLAKTV